MFWRRGKSIPVRDRTGRLASAAAHGIERLESRVLFATHYVDVNSPGPVQDGASWDTAYVDLQLALAAAGAGDEIRVADGVYKPTSGTDRTISFALKTGVTITGGYAGFGAANPDARDTDLYLSVLSGDIGIAVDPSDNSYHVVIGTGTNSTAVLDGFTITAGNANGAGNDERGGGLGGLNTPTAGGPKIVNCRFVGNSAIRGGAAYISGMGTQILNCEIESNVATLGGGLYAATPTMVLADTTFTSNVASELGGGMYHTSSPTLSRCTFVRNSAGSGGAAYSASMSTNGPTWNYCQFLGNTAQESGGGVFVGGTSTVRVTNCIFVGNTARRGGALFDPLAGQLRLTNVTICSNKASLAGGGVYWDYGTALSLPQFSLMIFSSILWANQAPSGSQLSYPPLNQAEYSLIEDDVSGHPGVINQDPCFIRNPDNGNDGKWGTADDDYGDLRISVASPAVDRGAVWGENYNVPTDLAGNNRFQDVPSAPNLGTGPPDVIDMGAYEAVPSLDAHAGGPYFSIEGQSVTLIGRGASTAAGSLSYAWEWTGDGGFDDASGPHPIFLTSSLPIGSEVSIHVQVTDSIGRTVTAQTTLHVIRSTIYVDQNAAGSNDGSSWADAYTDLRLALQNSTHGQTVRVAGGTYKPSEANDRDAAFTVSAGVKVLGGFAGSGAVDPDARNIVSYLTTLSGDIGIANDISDNSYHVVTATDITFPARLDGFHIVGGNASFGSPEDRKGGGLKCYNALIDIANCTFAGNSASMGGGLYGGSMISGCAFIGNTAELYSAGVSGLGPYVNCTFWGNQGSNTIVVSSTTLINCIVRSNSNLQFTGSLTKITYSNIQGGNSGLGNIDADPLFVRNPNTGPDAIWGTSDDDYGDLRLQVGSPSIDAGSNAAVPDTLITDMGGLPRIGDAPGVNDPGLIVDMGTHEVPGGFGILSAAYRLDLPKPTVKIKFSNDLLSGSLTQDDLQILSSISGDTTNYAMVATFSYDPETWSGLWTFWPSLVQGNYHPLLPASSVNAIDGTPLGSERTFEMFILPGDANYDRKVDLQDLMILAANWQGSGKTFAQGDFNYDGLVDAADLGILAQRWQTRLDPVPPPHPSPPIPTSAVRRAPIRTPTRVSDQILR